MAELNQFATGFSARPAGPGSFAVRADLGFSSLLRPCSGRPILSPFPFPQYLDGQSRRFDDHTLAA
jgi:hypothetical protein